MDSFLIMSRFYSQEQNGVSSLDVNGLSEELLKAGWTVPVCAQALLDGGHEVLQVLGEVLVLVAKQVDLQGCLVDDRTVLLLGHAVQDPQHLDGGVVIRVHKIKEVLHKLPAQEHTQLPGEGLVVPQDNVQEHEEAIDGAGVFQTDLHVEGNAGDGLAAGPDGVHTTPRQHWPPEGAVLLLIVTEGSPDLLKQSLGPIKPMSQLNKRKQNYHDFQKETVELPQQIQQKYVTAGISFLKGH